MRFKTLMFYAIAFAAITAQAAEMDFTYNMFGLQPRAYELAAEDETVDVAVRLGANLCGKRITGLQVTLLGDVSAYSSPEAFLTTKLNTKTQNGHKYNLPDICSIPAAISDGILSVTFAEPYEIPDDGIFIGYSITVEGSASPVAVVDMPEMFPVGDSFWYHATSSQMKWKDLAATKFLASAMTVCLEGDFPADAATAILGKRYNIAADKGGDVDVCIINQGCNPLGSFRYTVSIDGTQFPNAYEFSGSEAPAFSHAAIASISIPSGLELGEQTFSVSIDEVNGSANYGIGQDLTSSLQVLPFIPACRPLVEEYTGLQCGWCPEGYVLLKELSEQYGHEFVAMAYHSEAFENGCMVYLTREEFPYTPSGYPFAQIDRTSLPSVSAIPQMWDNARKNLPDGEVVVDLTWDDQEAGILRADASARFIKDMEDAGYRFTVALVADGLSNPKWLQSNSYGSRNRDDYPGLEDSYWDLFIGTGSYVADLVFDDVVISFPNPYGIEDSLPQSLAMDKDYGCSVEFDVNDIVNVDGENVVGTFDNVRAIAMIIDAKTGKVINSASSGYPGMTGTEGAPSMPSVMNELYFDVNGIVITPENAKGLIIKLTHLSDGSVTSEKIIRH